jgi:hypothetical protein
MVFYLSILYNRAMQSCIKYIGAGMYISVGVQTQEDCIKI